jgi:hypothetical protein
LRIEHVKNTVKSRVLQLAPRKTFAPRKAFALRTAALMACVTAISLVVLRDAAAVAGIPHFPHIDVTLPALLSATPAPAVLAPQGAQLANQMSQLTQPQTAPAWNGLGELPNSFKAPWRMPEAELDPGFRVSYWNPIEGYKNTADAPWNHGLGGQLGASSAIFDSLVASAGKGIMHSPQIIWDPTALPVSAGAAL